MGPHQSQMADSDGLPDERALHYFARRARGGVAMMVVEGGVLHPNSRRNGLIFRAYEPAAIARWKPIVAACQAEGAVMVAQLLHSGRQANAFMSLTVPLWSASAISCPYFRMMPKEMEVEDIQQLVTQYGASARYMREAGFDGVEVHACHGYLLNQFMSPYSNKRTDQYGGSLENRMRIVLDAIAAVRAQVGDDTIVGLRLESNEHVPGGLVPDETAVMARMIEATGNVDYLSISQGVRETGEFIRAPTFVDPGYAVGDAGRIKDAVQMPVFVVGRLNHPDHAEAALASGKVDAVVLTRELIADPDYPRNTLENRSKEIRRCVGCSECVVLGAQGIQISCLYNPEIGHEGRGALEPAATPRRVVVIGGGPGGLEAARVARIRGHEVVLFEKEKVLGGALAVAARIPGRADFGFVADYYQVALQKSEVDVRLGCEATVDSVLAERPDAVVVATGARPLMPPSPLLPPIAVSPGADLIAYTEALARPWKPGSHVVLVDGEYNALGMSVAEHLVGAGVTVTFVTKAEKPALFLDGPTQKVWFQRLCSRGVSLAPFRALVGVDRESARLKHTYGGAEERIDCTAVVLALARTPNDELYVALKGRTKVHRVGDCVAPTSAMFATNAAFEVATRL